MFDNDEAFIFPEDIPFSRLLSREAELLPFIEIEFTDAERFDSRPFIRLCDWLELRFVDIWFICEPERFNCEAILDTVEAAKPGSLVRLPEESFDTARPVRFVVWLFIRYPNAEFIALKVSFIRRLSVTCPNDGGTSAEGLMLLIFTDSFPESESR